MDVEHFTDINRITTAVHAFLAVLRGGRMGDAGKEGRAEGAHHVQFVGDGPLLDDKLIVCWDGVERRCGCASQQRGGKCSGVSEEFTPG